VPELAKHLREDVAQKSFDPAKPDPFSTVNVPLSPAATSTEKPAGS